SISSGIKSPLPGKFIIFYSPFLNSRMAPNTRSSTTPLNNDVNVDDNVRQLLGELVDAKFDRMKDSIDALTRMMAKNGVIGNRTLEKTVGGGGPQIHLTL
ncbi:hypothetical protein Tco_0766540, partial [Tanacetum coccineum]